MSFTTEEVLRLLEEKANILKKTQINLKKCPKQRLTKGYIEIRLKSVEEDWQTFKTYHQTLVKITPKETQLNIPYFVNEDYYLIEDLYLCLASDLKDMLLTFTNSRESHISTEAILPQVKLPNIKLPTFSGQYEEWPTFNDLFMSLVHHNETLTKVQKLHYLKSSIAGEAEALLKHINVTENNYEPAWEILKKRYGNKRLIINSLLKRLFGQKKITSQVAHQIKGLVDTTTECLNSLSNLKVCIDGWDTIIIYLVVQRLDVDTHKAWEDLAYSPDSDKLPTWQELKNFLEAKFRTLELITPMSTTRESRSTTQRTFHISAPVPVKLCIICKERHTLCHCNEFNKLSIKERGELAKDKNLCFNCLIPGHSARRCRLRVSCKICNRRHHTLMHQTPQETSSPTRNEEIQANITISSHMATKKCTSLLATALVPIKNEEGRTTILRALIDQGSQASFVSERAAQLIGVKREAARGTITGVGTTQTEVNQVVQFQLQSRYDETFLLPVKAYVMPTRLTSQLPTKSLIHVTHTWPHLKDLILADPSYHQPGRVDLLLGVEVYAQILRNNLIKGPPGSPCAQETSLGWILFGEVKGNTSEEEITVMHHQVDFDDLLYKLWEIESNERIKLTKEEETCLKLYEDTYTRNEDGRYVIKLPFKTETLKVVEGNTREISRKRLIQLEKRLQRNPKLRTEYNKVMEEYLTLQHMEEVPEKEIEKPSVYLPHHAVVKEQSETTRVRVVFDASSPGTNNISLNDELLVGPQIQEDMRSLVMRFRLSRIGFIADIEKMYRQILVTKQDTDFQRILWRTDPRLPIKDYRMLTVTFGTASAPYLAVKTLQQVAEDEGQYHTQAAQTIKTDFFMDDLMSGQDTVSDAIDVAQNIMKILKSGGFTLQKWSSNSAEFLKIFESREISSNVRIDLNVGGTVRALGLSWNLNEDKLAYNTHLPPLSETVTKRNILAEIQHLFDPLGWLSPALFPAKILLQRLWMIGVGWDEVLQPEIKEEWLEIRRSLENLDKVQIDRWLYTTKSTLPNVTIHGFCDASTKGYGAVAYMRVKVGHQEYKTTLIAARTRVAPVKPVSLPRLELCGAVLLSKLLKQISEAMRIPIKQIYAWTDSMIVLSWLRGDPVRWQTFVRNRVVTIIDNIGHKWFHVLSQENPADITSRGMLLEELNTNILWWHGPDWLRHEEIMWRKGEDNLIDLEKKRDIINVNMKITQEENKKTILTQIEEFDNLTDLTKTIVYCKRFLKFKKQDKFEKCTTMTPEELSESLKICVIIAQEGDFGEEMTDLKEGKSIKKKGILRKLNPFMDQEGVLRVGGRLRHASISEEAKHPMILSSKCHLASLIVLDAHKRTLHGGVQLTMSFVRSRFWIVGLKSLVSHTMRKCLICARQRAVFRTQMMGDLPEARVTPARPFYNSGVDFAGPLQILRSKGRGSKSEKSYICIFICMATKAIHLELVGDLSTDSFLGAFKRFVARRGRCCHIWSDRGTNFIGAQRELQDMWKDARLNMPENVINLLAEDGTHWHFNPPYSPNFGGLWEAGVKSVKHHLKRILNTSITYEEMTTTLCQIEACLNSRPLCPIDNTDTDILEVLTPGHFLIGEAPVNIPAPNLKDVNWNRLSRWQHTQRLVQDFWHIWQTEYLTRLQQRPKWCDRKNEFQIGDVVLVKQDNLPPGKWALGRITEKHSGVDNMCRVYSLKSGGKIIKRPITKLCEFPVNT